MLFFNQLFNYMVGGEKSRRMVHEIAGYDDFYKRHKGDLSVRYNMTLSIMLYLVVVMNICCVVILSSHSSLFSSIFSGKLGLFSSRVPLSFSIALIALLFHLLCYS